MGGMRLGIFVLCRMVVELFRNSVRGVIYVGFWVSKTFLSITNDFERNY